MRSSILALAVVASCLSPLAHASADYSARFELTEQRLPTLLTGTGMDGPDSIAGQWTSPNRTDAVVETRATAGGPLNHSDNMHAAGGPPLQMGETRAQVYGAVSPATGTAAVHYTNLGANLQMPTSDATGFARATWTRDFSLDAHSSFTFSGLASIGISGDASPLDASTVFNIDTVQSFASLTLADAADRVRTSISATISSLFTGSLSDIFAYSIGPNGLLSLTISNHSDSALTGTLGAGSYVNVAATTVAAPVPEPAAMLSMLVGVGFVGAAARKRLRAKAKALAA